MASEKKKRKVDKRLHWGRGGRFLKETGKGIKGLSFYTPSQRRIDNQIELEDMMNFEIIAWGENPEDSRSKYVWTFIEHDGKKMTFVNDRFQSQSPSMTVTNNASTVVEELNGLLYGQGFSEKVEEIIYCDTDGSWDRYNAVSDSFQPCDNAEVELILSKMLAEKVKEDGNTLS